MEANINGAGCVSGVSMMRGLLAFDVKHFVAFAASVMHRAFPRADSHLLKKELDGIPSCKSKGNI